MLWVAAYVLPRLKIILTMICDKCEKLSCLMQKDAVFLTTKACHRTDFV